MFLEKENMRVGLTYDVKTDWQWQEGDPPDANAEFDKPETIEHIAAALEFGGHTVVRIGNVQSLLRQIENLSVDIVFNICEGIRGRNRESEVPVILEMNGIPFVGSDGLTLGITLDKAVAKKCFIADGVPTPSFFVARNADDLPQEDDLHFPLIVKTSYEGTSKGLTEASRVHDLQGLRRQVDLITRTYHQPALVEAFIPGMEFTVAVLGNGPYQPMPVVQVSIDGDVDLGERFYTFDYVTSSSLRYVCPPKISPELKQTLREMAVKAYRSVGCFDFGRVDFRVDDQGLPYVLEVNPLPSLGHDDIFNIFPRLIGSNYNEIINRILNYSCDRQGLAGGVLTS